MTDEIPKEPSSTPSYTQSLLDKKAAQKLAVELSDVETAEVEARLMKERARIMREVLALKSLAPEYAPALLPVPDEAEDTTSTIYRPSSQTLEGRIVLALTVMQMLLSLGGAILGAVGAAVGSLDMAAWGGGLTVAAGLLANSIAKSFSRDRSSVKKTMAENQ